MAKMKRTIIREHGETLLVEIQEGKWTRWAIEVDELQYTVATSLTRAENRYRARARLLAAMGHDYDMDSITRAEAQRLQDVVAGIEVGA